ncbi:MAG: efflux RND transporter periplasmic adaptor subunit [Halioglobus sp.]|nr:efflux RND transporter periplasmic adaptor subunit [Halioglobus sp.]
MTAIKHAIYLSMLLLAGCGGAEPETAMEPVALVTLEPVITGDLPVVLQSYGTVEFDPTKMHTLNAEIEARVLEVDAVAGEPVARNQVLVRLAPSSAGDTEVTQARRDANAAAAAAERTQRLRADGLASNADVEAADTAARDLEALAMSLEARSGAVLSLQAPIDGVVDGLFAATGDLIAPGTPLVRLASAEALQARLGIEVEDAELLRTGLPVHLYSLDNSAAAVDTTLSLIDMRIDPMTRMATALLTIPAGKGFHAGEAVAARIIAGTRQGVLIVPRTAVFNDETGSYVFSANKDTAVLKRVEVGLTSGEKTEIGTGIAAGDMVVVEGAATLADGMKIRTDAAGETP